MLRSLDGTTLSPWRPDQVGVGFLVPATRAVYLWRADVSGRVEHQDGLRQLYRAGALADVGDLASLVYFRIDEYGTSIYSGPEGIDAIVILKAADPRIPDRAGYSEWDWD